MLMTAIVDHLLVEHFREGGEKKSRGRLGSSL